MNLKRQIQSSMLGSGDYYQSVHWMIIYGPFNTIRIIERWTYKWTCIERVNQANVLLILHDDDDDDYDVPRFNRDFVIVCFFLEACICYGYIIVKHV